MSIDIYLLLFIILGGLLLLIVVLNKHHHLLFTFIASLPLELTAKGLFLTIPKIMGAVAITSWVFACIKNKKMIAFDKTAVYLLLFVICGLISYHWSIDPENTILFCSTYLLLLSMYLMICNYSTPIETLKLIMSGLMVGGIIILLFFVFELRSGIEVTDKRYYGITENPNLESIWILATFPGFYYRYKVSQSRIFRMLILCIVAGLLYVLILTGSRGGLIAISSLIIIPLFYKVNKLKIITFLVVIVAITYLTAPDYYWPRFENIGAETRGGRIEVLWPAGLRAIISSPIIGYGLGNNQLAILPMVGFESVVHCGPLAVTIELGVIGLFLYMMFLLSPLIMIIQKLRKSQETRKDQLILYDSSVLSVAVFGAIILTWLKGGGFEYNKLLFLYLSLMTILSQALYYKKG